MASSDKSSIANSMFKKLWAYERKISEIAALDAMEFLASSRKKITISLVSYFGFSVVYVLFTTWQKLMDRLVAIGSSAIFGILFWIALFIWYRTKAPIKLIDQSESEKQKILAENDVLKNNLEEAKRDAKPRAEVLFEAGNREYERTEPLVCPGLAKERTFCIGIHNPGNEMLHRCSVKLVKKDPPGAYLPISLKLNSENPLPDRGSVLYTQYDFKQEFDVKPHDTEHVAIAKFRETGTGTQIELCYATEGKKNGNINRWVSPQMDHFLYINIYSEKGDDIQTQFKLWVDSNNRFHCERIA